MLLVQTLSPERRQRELWAPPRVSLVAGREGRGNWGQADAAGTWGEGCQEPGCLLKCRQMVLFIKVLLNSPSLLALKAFHLPLPDNSVWTPQVSVRETQFYSNKNQGRPCLGWLVQAARPFLRGWAATASVCVAHLLL